MCLITEQKKPIKIRKDLTVYKLFNKTSNNYKFKPWSYPYDYDYNYEIGFLHKENLGFDNIANSYSDSNILNYYKNWNSEKYTHVHEGFHSAITIDRLSHVWDGMTLIKCTIPKGSLVFKDKTGLIVSNQIILKEIIK